MPKIFISRQLHAKSPFKLILEAKGFEVIGRSLLKFKAVDFGKIPKSDWLFFYSKNGVKFFFENKKNKSFKVGKKRIAAMGQGTALALEKYGISADFTGHGDPQKTAKAFLKVAAKDKVLFIRAAVSRNSVATLLSKKIQVLELIAYSNQAVAKPKAVEADALVFTSPMNAECYFRHFKKEKNQKIIAMGQTTAEVLRGLKVGRFSVAREASEVGLVAKVLERVGGFRKS